MRTITFLPSLDSGIDGISRSILSDVSLYDFDILLIFITLITRQTATRAIERIFTAFLNLINRKTKTKAAKTTTRRLIVFCARE